MARLVMVHGAFSGAWCWEPVLPALQQAGHRVDTLDLPGSGDDHTPVANVTLGAYADRVCALVSSGPPAVLVAHSMGGMVATQAAARRPEHVRALVYVSAFVPVPGESLMSLTQRPEAADDQIQGNMEISGEPPEAWLSNEAARMAIYGECSDEAAEWALARRRAQPVVPFTEPLELDESCAEAFAALPRSYVTCLRDRSIPPQMQRFMFERAGCDPVVEIDTDHAPYLSRKTELISALDQLVRRPAAASG